MIAREEILARIRGALHVQASDPANKHGHIARDYIRTSPLDEHATIELFIDRLIDYDTEVIQIPSDAEISGAVAQSLANADETALLAPAGFPSEWLPEGLAVTFDANLSHEALNAEKTVITTCEAAVASTGTIFLVHGGTQGRRVITLLPDQILLCPTMDPSARTTNTALLLPAWVAPPAFFKYQSASLPGI